MTLDIYKALFSGVTEHWVQVMINGKEEVFKFVPLSLKERLNITNKYSHVLDERERTAEIIIEQCKLMLHKAYGDEFNPKDFSIRILTQLYHAIMADLAREREELTEFYEKEKTKAINGKPSKYKNSKLNSLLSICNLLKECGLSLDDVSNLDETSLFCLMCYMDELATRESNAYEEAKAK